MRPHATRISIEAECPAAVAAARFGDGPALIGRGESTSFAELDGRVASTTQKLKSGGVTDGDVVALLADNSTDLICAILGLVRLGAVAVPISTRLPTPAVESAAQMVGARTLIVGSEARTSYGGDHFGRLSVLPLVDVAGSLPDGTGIAEYGVDPKRPCLAIFTSGSGGEPKAAALTLSNMIYSAIGANRSLPLETGDRWLLSLPLYHVGGLGILFRCLVSGAAVVLPSRSDGLADAIGEYGVNHISLVPTQMRRMIASGFQTDRLKAILLGGGPIPDDLFRSSQGAGARLHVTYGLTEMSSQVTASPRHPREDAADDAGNVLPYRSVRIAADGEILVRGETLFSGYLIDGRLQSATDEDGWFHTGDVGFFTAAEHLVVRGRRDNMFVSGGENIHPEEIEQAVSLLDGVIRVVVVDVPDHEFGARPVAFAEFSGPALSVEALRLRLRERLPRFKHPVAIYPFPAEAERTLEKPDRQLLREIARRRREAG